jgi:hypothetical protein
MSEYLKTLLKTGILHKFSMFEMCYVVLNRIVYDKKSMLEIFLDGVSKRQQM